MVEDDGLAAACGQLRQRALVRHAARQPQGVGERILLAPVGHDAHAAEGRPEGGAVDREEAA